MKGDVRGKTPQSQHDHHDPQAQHGALPIDDQMLRNYLADSLPPEDLARVEKALRDSADLRARLENVRTNREDFQLHTLGGIWRRTRLTCPSRQQLGSYLLDALDPALADYIKFHIDVVECPYCQANFADLERRQAGPPSPTTTGRRDRILKVVQDLLGEDRRGT